MTRQASLVEQITRRTFLGQSGVGVGAAALSSLLSRDLRAAGARLGCGDGLVHERAVALPHGG